MKDKLSFSTRVAYGCGDVACRIVYSMVGTLLTLFYTDYIGIPAAAIAAIMLVSRLFDGVSDFIMGFIVERTHSKYGQSRPWVLWMALPFAVSGVLLFTVPHTSLNLQLIYIFITYNVCTTVIYTALNLPYGSLSAMMTRDSHERDVLSIFRMGMAPVGSILIVSVTLPLVKALGDNQFGWIIAMSIYCAIAFILLIICFAKCKETVVIPAREKAAQEHKEHTPMGKSIKALFSNRYFWICVIAWLCMSSYMTAIGTILPYYCKYILGNDTTLYSTLYVLETVIYIIIAFVCVPLVKKFGKRNLILYGAILALAAQIVFAFNSHSIMILYITTIIRGIGIGPLFALVFGLIGDAVEYGQYKTHLRQECLVFSAGSLGSKVGVGIFSAAITGLLSYSGYVSSTTGGVVQSQTTLNMISNLYKYTPMILFTILIIIMAIYQLDKIYPDIMKELEEREARGEL